MGRSYDNTYSFGNYNGVNYIKWDNDKKALIYTNNMASYKKTIPLETLKSSTRKEDNSILWEEL